MFTIQSAANRIIVSSVLLWLAHFAVDFMLGVWPVYKTMVHLDLAKAGMIAAACSFCGEGMQIVFGSLCDKGYRKLLTLAGVLSAGAGTLFAYTQDYYYLLILFFFVYMGSGMFHPAAVGLAGSLTQKRKALYITIFSTGGALGMATSQIIYSNVYSGLSGHTVWMIIPPILLIIGCLGYRFTIEKEVPTEKPKTKLSDIFDFFKKRELKLLYLSGVSNQTVLWATMFLLPDVLLSREYESWVAYGGGHLCFVLGGGCMMIPGGYFADKYSAKSVIFAATVSGFILFYSFLFMPFISEYVILALLFALGAAMGVIQPVAVAYGHRLEPGKTGLVGAFLMGLVWCVSESMGPGGGGLLTKLFDGDAPAKALSLMGLLYGIGIYASYSLSEEREEDAPLAEVI